MKNNLKISIVIPAYNEESSIGKTIIEIKKIFDKIKYKNYEIIIINNNSNDKTSEIAKSNGAKVLFEPFKPGYGASYKRGFKFATGDIIITGDADSTYPFYDIPRFLKILTEKKIDFITTNRFAILEKNSMPLINNFGNIFLTIITNLLYHTKLKDSQSGMWIFNKNFLKSINLDILGQHMSFSQEIKLYAIYLKNIKFLEIPIRYRVRIGEKKLRPIRDGLENLKQLIKFKKKISKKKK